jgi:hypothetical protein
MTLQSRTPGTYETMTIVKFLSATILTMASVGAFACEPYGLQGVTVGAVPDKAKIDALFISKESGQACYNDLGAGAWCTNGTAVILGQSAHLAVAERDGRIAYIWARFPIGAFKSLVRPMDNYCTVKTWGLGESHGMLRYNDAAGDRILLDTNYKDGLSFTTLLIESKAQNEFNKAQVLEKARRQPVCGGSDPVQQFLDTDGICRLPESAFRQR